MVLVPYGILDDTGGPAPVHIHHAGLDLYSYPIFCHPSSSVLWGNVCAIFLVWARGCLHSIWRKFYLGASSLGNKMDRGRAGVSGVFRDGTSGDS